MAILNLQDFSFTGLFSFLMPLAFAYVVAMVMVVVASTCMCKLTWLCVLLYNSYKLLIAWGYLAWLTNILCCHGNGCGGFNMCVKFHCLIY